MERLDIKMYKCLVLMATYNGEKYLDEQLQSILNQKDVSVDIFVSDDKSSDDTLNILKEYALKYKNFKYRINKSNKGFTYNFIDLIFDSNIDYDFFALSDQDDVWLDNKLLNAIKMIEQTNQENVLYCSNLELVNSSLKHIGYQEKKDIHKNKYSTLISNIATGCTCVFDKGLMIELRKKYRQDIYLHDYWLCLVAEFTGLVIYDTKSYILYRQHDNLIGSNKKLSFGKIKNLFNPKHKTSDLIKEFYRLYKEDIHINDLNKVEMVVNYDKSILSTLKLVFSPVNSRSKKLAHKIQFLFRKF